MVRTPNGNGAGLMASGQTPGRQRPNDEFTDRPESFERPISRAAALRDVSVEAVSGSDHNVGLRILDGEAAGVLAGCVRGSEGAEQTSGASRPSGGSGGRRALAPKQARGRVRRDEPSAAQRGDEQAKEAVRVLIVDDEPNLCEISRIGLQSVGIDAVSVGSGAEAVACFEGERFDLVLLDVNMPGADGWETLERLRALTPGQHVLMVSGQASASEARERGALGLLGKPFDLEALVDAVVRGVQGLPPARRD